MMEKNELTVCKDANRSEIADFFAGCNVLVTGGSGFVGKLLVEKLLRSCSEVKKIYLIMRGKKGKSVEERYNEYFEDAIYDRLKSEQPDFASKIVVIEGGLDASGLALSLESRTMILDSHVVFHGAATVRFDDKLRFAVNINVRGTKEVLLLAREMRNLKALVHIGTAFSMCVDKFIDEVFYKPPIDSDDLLTLLDILDDNSLEQVTPALLGKWPNTYAFTKTLAEDVVAKHGKDLPVCIVRPSIMVPTASEPIAGWINNLYGATGVVVGAGLGVLHTLHCDKNNVADIIPADYVINNLIASAWDIGTTFQQQKQLKELSDAQDQTSAEPEPLPPIYNSVSSCQNPITWGEYMQHNEITGLAVPSSMNIWCYWFRLNSNLWIHTIYTYLTHLLPALIVDTLARLTGRKPGLLKTYQKIHKFSGVIAYFCTQQWKFRNNNVVKLWDKLSPLDKKIFYFNMTQCDWSEYFYYHIRGLRVYLLKDSLDNLDASLKRYSRLKLAHSIVLPLASALLLWLLYFVVTSLFLLLKFIIFR